MAYSLFALGVLFATITAAVELYRIMQTAMLSWDTDGDGVVSRKEFARPLVDTPRLRSPALSAARALWEPPGRR